MVTPTTIAAYLALFTVVACAFVLVNLTLGKLVRPHLPSPEKKEIYECGEPVIGSSFVRFDIRFYVVALLFIIFDVEVAFFFPWAVVFGKATQIAAAGEAAASSPELVEASAVIMTERARELGFENAVVTGSEVIELGAAAQGMVWGCAADILIFFTVLMVGFAYVWSRGDLDWVRTTVNKTLGEADPAPSSPSEAA